MEYGKKDMDYCDPTANLIQGLGFYAPLFRAARTDLPTDAKSQRFADELPVFLDEEILRYGMIR